MEEEDREDREEEGGIMDKIGVEQLRFGQPDERAAAASAWIGTQRAGDARPHRSFGPET